MAGQTVECQVCHNIGKSELRGSMWISFLLFWFVMMVPGIIYMIWRRGGLGVCRFCSSEAVIPYYSRKTKLVENEMMQPKLESKEIQCPYCRENIHFEATKCKHCGSIVHQ